MRHYRWRLTLIAYSHWRTCANPVNSVRICANSARPLCEHRANTVRTCEYRANTREPTCEYCANTCEYCANTCEYREYRANSAPPYRQAELASTCLDLLMCISGRSTDGWMDLGAWTMYISPPQAKKKLGLRIRCEYVRIRCELCANTVQVRCEYGANTCEYV